jgi:hypothetical protein
MAMWAAGPPKAVMPNLRNNAATSANFCDHGDFIWHLFGRCQDIAEAIMGM